MLLIFYKIFCLLCNFVTVYILKKVPAVFLIKPKVNFGLLSLKGITYTVKDGFSFPFTYKVNNSSIILDTLYECVPAWDIYTATFLVVLLITDFFVLYYIFILPREEQIDALANKVFELMWDEHFEGKWLEAMKELTQDEFFQSFMVSDKATNLLCDVILKSNFTSSIPPVS